VRIAILHREYPPHTIYVSTSVLYQDLARAFAAKGHEVHVVCQSKGTPLGRKDDGVFVHEVGTNVQRASAVARAAYSYHAWRKLGDLIRRHDIDLVNAEFFLAEGLLYSLRKGKAPLVLQVHAWAEGWLEANSHLRAAERRVTSYLEKLTARRADRIIATSRSTWEWLVERIHTPRGKVAIVHEPIDISIYRPVKSSMRERLYLSSDVPLVLFASALELRKGPHILAQAIPLVLRQVPEARFVVAGRDINVSPEGGSMKGFMQGLVERDGFDKNLMFLGPLSADDMVQAYSVCDVFVYPGLLEAGGKPPIEAMACNRPIVATATGIAAELDGVSPAILVVPPGDPQALAEAIASLLSLSKEQRESMSAGHRRIVQDRFSCDKVVEETLAVYEQAIAGRRQK
jgi:1,4-alpha-glucan branching enzyme